MTPSCFDHINLQLSCPCECTIMKQSDWAEEAPENERPPRWKPSLFSYCITHIFCVALLCSIGLQIRPTLSVWRSVESHGNGSSAFIILYVTTGNINNSSDSSFICWYPTINTDLDERKTKSRLFPSLPALQTSDNLRFVSSEKFYLPAKVRGDELRQSWYEGWLRNDDRWGNILHHYLIFLPRWSAQTSHSLSPRSR